MKKHISILCAITLVALFFGFSGSDKNPSDRDPNYVSNTNNANIKEVKGAPQTVFSSTLAESFEGTTFPPAGWTKIQVAAGATGWERQLSGVTPVPGFNGGTLFTPVGGGTAMAFANYLTGGSSSNDEWLITPQITNVQPGDSLTFWLRKFGNYVDHLDIKISTTTNSSVASFTYTVANIVFPAINDTAWTRKAYALSSVSGLTAGSNIYVGFREHVTDNLNDGDVVGLDLISLVGSTVGVINNGTGVPSSYELAQNYPNPFNPSTKINFSIPKAGNVKLAVYDMIGNEVSVITNGELAAGNYTASFNASKLSSGVYFYKLVTGEFTSTKRMILVK